MNLQYIIIPSLALTALFLLTQAKNLPVIGGTLAIVTWSYLMLLEFLGLAQITVASTNLERDFLARSGLVICYLIPVAATWLASRLKSWRSLSAIIVSIIVGVPAYGAGLFSALMAGAGTLPTPLNDILAIVMPIPACLVIMAFIIWKVIESERASKCTPNVGFRLE